MFVSDIITDYLKPNPCYSLASKVFAPFSLWVGFEF